MVQFFLDLQKKLSESQNKTTNEESNVTEPVTVTEVPDTPPPPPTVEEKVEIKLNKSEPEIKVQLKKR